MSSAHSVFKHSVYNIHQLQQHVQVRPTADLPAGRVTAEPVSSTRRQIVCNVLKLQFCLLLSL